MRGPLILLIGTALLAGCATTDSGPTIEQLRASGAMSVVGRITKRTDYAANSRYAVNESHTRANTGTVGMLISQLRGTPRYYEYWVKGRDEPQYSIQASEEFYVGNCVRVFIPRDKEGKRGWFLGEVAVENAKECP